MNIAHETATVNGSAPDVLGRFDEAPPTLLEARALQQRVDRKYLLPKALLDSLLDGLTATYLVARAGDVLLARYDTLYFDTLERQMYEDHRRGRRPRYKVRVRHHVDRSLTFLEVKRKGSTRTKKARIELPCGETQLDANARRFIDEHCPVNAARLIPRVSVAFLRLTLVGDSANERVTFDWSIEFRDGQRHERVADLVIAEIKQARYSNTSDAVRILRGLRVREQALSKYCLATARLAPVRTNTFTPALRAIEQLSS